MRLTALLALATVTTAACGTPEAEAHSAPTVPPAATEVVTTDSLPATVTVEGTIRARQRAAAQYPAFDTASHVSPNEKKG